MKPTSVASLLLVALAAWAVASASACCQVDGKCVDQPCPKGFLTVTTDKTTCGYQCAFSVPLSCSFPSIIKLPVTCGGTSSTKCPAIACSSSSSTAISGPGGCARAQSRVKALSKPQSASVSKSLYKEFIQTVCAEPGINVKNEAKIEAIATAVATATAIAYAEYDGYVCTCCRGSSAALTEVAADVRAIALAEAAAFVEAAAAVNCNGVDLQAASSGLADAYAKSLEVAILTVYQKAAASSSKQLCDQIPQKTERAIAVAKAAACAMTRVAAFVKYNVDQQPLPNAESCSATLSLAGSSVDNTITPFNFECKCLYYTTCARKLAL